MIVQKFQQRIRFVISPLLLLTASVGLVGLVGCRKADSPQAAGGGRGGPGAAAGPNANQPPRPVKLVAAAARTMPLLVEAPGTLAADEQATISFKVAGRLEKLLVDFGSPVRKGQVLGQLETQDFKARVTQAEAALQQARARLGLAPTSDDDKVTLENTAQVKQAKAVLDEARGNLERSRQLVKEGVQPRAELDRVESAYKVADSRYQDAIEEVRNREALLMQRRSELNSAKQQLAETTVYAPLNGAIREKRANQGEFLTAGTPIVTIVRIHPLRLRVEVPEREARTIRAGQPLRVSVDGEFDLASGRVARLSPAIQEQSRTLIIEAEVDNQNGRLRPGSFAKAQIQTSTQNDVITVPTSAVVAFAGIYKVFMVKDGKAVERPVVIGRREADWIEITEGLKAGEQLILAPGNLNPGQPVNVSQ